MPNDEPMEQILDAVDAIGTANSQMVGVSAGNIIVMNPKRSMTKDEALLHAAWLVALADPDEHKFQRIFDNVMSI